MTGIKEIIKLECVKVINKHYTKLEYLSKTLEVPITDILDVAIKKHVEHVENLILGVEENINK